MRYFFGSEKEEEGECEGDSNIASTTKEWYFFMHSLARLALMEATGNSMSLAKCIHRHSHQSILWVAFLLPVLVSNPHRFVAKHLEFLPEHGTASGVKQHSVYPHCRVTRGLL